MEHESDDDTNCNRCARYGHHRIGKGTGGLGNKNTSGNNPINSTAKIGQNTKKSPKDLRGRCHSNSSKKKSADAGVKHFQKSKIIIMI